MAQTRTTQDPAEAIIAALHQLGQSTAADIATAAGIAYSTTTRNLRELAAAGRAEKVADGKQSQWRLPATANPGADTDTDAGARSGADARTEAGTEVDIQATSLSTPDAAGPDETTDAATPAATTITETTDQPTDTTDPTDDSADNATADDHATDQERGPDKESGPDDGARDDDGQNNSDQDGSEEDDAPSPADQVEDGVQANRTDDAADDESTAGTDIDAASPDSTDTPDGAATDSGPTAGPAQTAATAKPRRASGTLDGAVLDILEAHPERGFKVSELCKLINAANEGQDVSKASPGAVVLAGQRLVTKGKAILAPEKPATFQLIPADTTTVAGPATGTTGR